MNYNFAFPKAPKGQSLPPRRLTHKDAKAAARLYGLTYEEVRAKEYAHNEAARRKDAAEPDVIDIDEADLEDAGPDKI